MAINLSESGGVRQLHFGSDWVQGAMRIARPWSLELEYTREMMAALLLRPDPRWPRRVLQIGLGAASLTKYLYRHRPRCSITVVEIDGAVLPVAYQSFRLPEDEKRIHVVLADGADFIQSGDKRYDLILVDGFDARARSGPLETESFYQACQQRLTDQGLTVVNYLTRKRTWGTNLDRLHRAFDGRALCFPSCDSGNAVAFAATGDPVRETAEELKASAFALRKDTGLNLLPTLARLTRVGLFDDGALVL